MVYIIENNGVYGLTKGQFSASADIGSKAKRGEVNKQPPIDPVQIAMSLGGTFVARSFSGDKEQLVPLIKAGVRHNGFALIDVLSPCVTFNDHEASTKSYAHTREFNHPVIHADFVPPAQEIKAQYDEGDVLPVELHDGSRAAAAQGRRRTSRPADRGAAIDYIRAAISATARSSPGLLYIDEGEPDLHGVNGTTRRRSTELPLRCAVPRRRRARRALQQEFR